MTLSELKNRVENGNADAFEANYDLEWSGSLELLHGLIDHVRGSVGEAADLFEVHLPEDLLPETGLQLDAVELTNFSTLDLPDSTNLSYHLFIAFSWPDAILELIPELFSIRDFHVALNFTDNNYSFELNGIISINGVDLAATIDLPSLMFEADLVTFPMAGADIQFQGETTGLFTRPSPDGLLQRFQVDPRGEVAGSGELSLDQFILFGNPRAKRFFLHLEISNLELGPVILDFQTRINWSDGAIGGMFWSVFEIEDIPTITEGADPLQLSIPVYAAHDGPTTGWQLAGGIAMQDVDFVGLFTALARKFNAHTPIHPALNRPGVNLEYVYLSLDTKTRAFSFSCALNFHDFFETTAHSGAETNPRDTTELTIQVDVHPDPEDPSRNEFTFSGQLVFKLAAAADASDQEPLALEFDFVFDRTGSSQKLIAVYRNLGGGQINITRLMHQLNDQVPEMDLTFDLQQAFLIYAKETAAGASSRYLLGAELGFGVSLANIPLVGQLFKKTGDPRLVITPLHASAAYSAAQLAEYQDLVPGDGLALPDRDLDSETTYVDATLYLGGQPLHLALALGTHDLGNTTTGSMAEADSSSSSAGNAVIGDGTTWFDVNRTFSKIFHLARVGMQYDGATRKFWFKLNGSVTAGPVSLSVLGLGMGAALPDLEPSFQLQGLGLDFRRGGLEVGGAFLRTTQTGPDGKPYDEYAGTVLIKWKQLTISAIGAYAKYKGHPSLFIYTTLNYPLGGPSFFFVTGLALGFGINRKVKAPERSKDVETFPLVQQAINPGGATDDITEVIASLHDTIPARVGQYFIAVGIKFTSFKLVDSFLLLVVNFGVELEFDLLGLSTLEVPVRLADDPKVTVKEGRDSITRRPNLLAKVQMAVGATYLPETGYLDVHADLTNESFILSPACRLSGGFAFRAWFEDSRLNEAKAGEFVMTLGGYHPDFRPPSYYPQPARLAFDWQVTDKLLIHGEAYYALTAHLLMAGGSLRATYDSKFFSAHFEIGANFLVSWKPFHYEADAHVEIGVETGLGDFDISAKVEIWGPDFSGTAEIDVGISTLHIDFGNERGQVNPVSWKNFHASFLPADRNAVCHINVARGLIDQQDTPEIIYRVNPNGFTLAVTSAIPASSLLLDPNNPSRQEDQDTRVGIGPMALTNLSSVLKLVEIQDQHGTDVSDKFTPTATRKDLPWALWGGKLKPELNGHRYLSQALSGFQLQLKPPEEVVPSLSVARSHLNFDTFPVQNGLSIGRLLEFQPMADAPLDLTSTAITQARAASLKALGFREADLDISIDAGLADAFTHQPLVGEH